jgi:spore coat protein H
MTTSNRLAWAAILCLCALSRADSRPTTRPTTQKVRPDTAETFFDNGPLPRLHIEADPKELKTLNNNPRAPIRAQVRETIPGQPDRFYCDVALHLKGGPGSFRRVEDKPALTINFDHFVAGQSFHGLDKIHLNNSVQDASYLNEYLGSYIFRAAGCPAPRVSHARVWLNRRDLGAFVLKEGFDSVLYRKYFRDGAGDLYEGSFADVDSNLPVHMGHHHLPSYDSTDPAASKKRAGELANLQKQSAATLRKLAEAARDPDPLARGPKLAQILDVDRFLTFYACEAMVAHWDGYSGNRNNYRIYHDLRTDRLIFLPQGMDQLFQRPDYSLFLSDAIIPQALSATIEDRQRYFDRITKIRNTVMTPQAMTEQIDRISAHVLPLMEELGPDAVRQFKEQAAATRRAIRERIAGIDRQLANPPKPLEFDSNGIAKLDHWEPKIQEGNATTDKYESEGQPRLRVTCNAPGGAASWRTTLLLRQGHYTFEGRLKTIAVKSPPGLNTAAGLRISRAKRTERVEGDSPWQTIQFDFDVAQPLAEVILVCDLAATSGQAVFDPTSLKLRKKLAAE